MRISAIALTLVGAALLVVAALFAIGEARYLSTAQRASGEIVDMQSQLTAQSNGSFPVIRFTASDGVQVEFQSHLSSSEYRVGQEVVVVYQAADPKGTASIDDPIGNYLVSIVAAVFGLVALPLGLGLLGVLHVPQGLRRMRWPSLSPASISPALLLAGGLFLAGAVVAANAALGWQATTAEGTVTAFVVDSNFNHYPRVEFTASNGRPHSFVSNTGSNPTPYHVGQRVSVYYDPADPGRADLDRWGGAGLVTVVLGGFAAVLFLFGVITRFMFAGGGPPPGRGPVQRPRGRSRRQRKNAGADA